MPLPQPLTKHTTGKVFKLYSDFNVFSAENRRLFSIEFQLHTNSRITLWLPVVNTNLRMSLLTSFVFASQQKMTRVEFSAKFLEADLKT